MPTSENCDFDKSRKNNEIEFCRKGIDFPKMVDEAGSNEVMRSAAGLPEVATNEE